MDFTPRYSGTRSNSESSTVYASSPEQYELNFKAHWSNNMYSQQHLSSPSKQQLLRGTVDENGKNYNFNSRMYSTKQSLSVDNMANQPKKETLWQTMFRSATNLLGEHLTRGTGSFLRNWSSMNNPLSVTVVSPDFYKSLQRGKDHQLVDPSSGIYTTRMWDNKESHSSDDTLPNVLYDNEILSDSVGKQASNSDTSDSDKRWKEYKCMYVDFNETQVKVKEQEKEKEQNKEQDKDLIMDEKIVNSVNNKSDCNDKALESNFNIVVNNTKDLDRATNFGNTLKVDDEPVMLEKPEPPSQGKSFAQPTMVGAMLSNAYNKVVNRVADLLQQQQQQQQSSEIADSSCSLFTTKRACSPKPRPKRAHNISGGRGRGRAKSQLRRSGVSQTRHRKERSRYDRSEDIKSDIDNWEELDLCQSNPNSNDDDKDLDVCDFAGSAPGQFDNACPSDDDDDDDVFVQYGGRRRSSMGSFTLADVKPRKRKPKKPKVGGWAQVNVAAFSVPSCLDEVGGIDPSCVEKLGFRPRLLSESSLDSDDSYCIVFENEGCSESDYETDDAESYLDSETETEDDDEEVANETEGEFGHTSPGKVKFDLTPRVHPMVQWNYAYRAARRGPWEEMARDRERFRGRIGCIGRVLEPVLAKQHRARVWRERFAD